MTERCVRSRQVLVDAQMQDITGLDVVCQIGTGRMPAVLSLPPMTSMRSKVLS
jgi:hypothetical protein